MTDNFIVIKAKFGGTKDMDIYWILQQYSFKEIIIFALRYGIIKSQYDTKSIAYLLDTDEKFITNTLKLIHTKLGLKNI